MTIEDIERYILRYQLNTNSRKAEVIDQRMYLYAYLFYIHDLSLQKVGRMFAYINKKGELTPKDHSTVLHALKKADYFQHEDRFVNNTQLLSDQCRFVIPPYDENNIKARNQYQVCITVGKDKFIEFMREQDETIVYEYLWSVMTSTAIKEQAKTLNHNTKYKQSS